MASHNTKNYGSVQYWDERYAKQQDVTFDWVEQYPEIRDVLNEHCIKVLYEQHLAAIEQAKKMKEAEEELARILEREEENGEERKQPTATEKVLEFLASRQAKKDEEKAR